MAFQKKRGAKLLRQRLRENPTEILEDLYLAYCDVEDESSGGWYQRHRDIWYWTDSKGEWVPSLWLN